MYSDIAANKRKTVFLILVFVVFIVLLAWIFSLAFGNGNNSILIGSLVGATIYAAITYYSGARMALAVNGATQLQKSDNPRLWNIIENIAITDGLPMPKVYIIEDPSPNAFATGRDPRTSSVCATTGLLSIMNDSELQGVFAHEMGHIKNYDIRVSMVAFALTVVISVLADIILRMTWFRSSDNESENSNIMFFLGIVAAILAPLIAALIQLAVSRQREYLADATSALTTRYPEGLISALRKIEQSGSALKKQNTATAHLFFANPLKKRGITNLFSTHPPIQERIARLQAMGSKA